MMLDSQKFMRSNMDKQDRKPLGLPLVGAGNMFVSMIVSGFLLGYLVDEWLDTRPLFMIVLGMLGLVGGFLKAHQLTRRIGGS